MDQKTTLHIIEFVTIIVAIVIIAIVSSSSNKRNTDSRITGYPPRPPRAFTLEKLYTSAPNRYWTGDSSLPLSRQPVVLYLEADEPGNFVISKRDDRTQAILYVQRMPNGASRLTPNIKDAVGLEWWSPRDGIAVAPATGGLFCLSGDTYDWTAPLITFLAECVASYAHFILPRFCYSALSFFWI